MIWGRGEGGGGGGGERGEGEGEERKGEGDEEEGWLGRKVGGIQKAGRMEEDWKKAERNGGRGFSVHVVR